MTTLTLFLLGYSISLSNEVHAMETIQGERLTQGNAVNCPVIRDKDGKEHSVSYLPPSVEIGDWVEVSGNRAYLTTCLGEVLKVETVVPIKKN